MTKTYVNHIPRRLINRLQRKKKGRQHYQQDKYDYDIINYHSLWILARSLSEPMLRLRARLPLI